MLADFAGRERPPGRACALLQEGRAFDTWLPDPCDEVAGVVRDVLARAARAGGAAPVRVRVRASEPAPPSAHLAFELGLRLLAREGALVVEVERPSTGADAPSFLWGELGAAPRPALAAPPDDVLAAASSLAASAYDLAAWFRRANELAGAIARDRRASFAATMVHPPAPPPQTDPVRWVQRVQVAAALLVSHADEGWVVSDRRRVLRAIATGPDDWTTAAAFIALYCLAHDIADPRREAAALIEERLSGAVTEGSTLERVLLVLSLRLQVGSPAWRRAQWRRLREPHVVAAAP
jgi:hypothetical protein